MVRAGLLAIAVSLELLVGALILDHYAPWFLGPVFDFLGPVFGEVHPPTIIGRFYLGAMTIAFVGGTVLVVLGVLSRWAQTGRKAPHRWPFA